MSVRVPSIFLTILTFALPLLNTNEINTITINKLYNIENKAPLILQWKIIDDSYARFLLKYSISNKKYFEEEFCLNGFIEPIVYTRRLPGFDKPILVIQFIGNKGTQTLQKLHMGLSVINNKLHIIYLETVSYELGSIKYEMHYKFIKKKDDVYMILNHKYIDTKSRYYMRTYNPAILEMPDSILNYNFTWLEELKYNKKDNSFYFDKVEKQKIRYGLFIVPRISKTRLNIKKIQLEKTCLNYDPLMLNYITGIFGILKPQDNYIFNKGDTSN